MSIIHKICFRLAQLVRLTILPKIDIHKAVARPACDFKLLYFCGADGIEYLNVSLYSIYRNWRKIPELVIVTDGTPPELIRKKIIDWPVASSIVSWEKCATWYRDNGNTELYNYACSQLWGRKFVSLLYFARKARTLYTDTDIIWYKYPEEMEGADFHHSSIVMSQDVEYCYDDRFIKTLGEEKCYESIPLNAGLIYLNSDFEEHPKWLQFCKYVELKENAGHRTEQTFFACLHNYFNPGIQWSRDRILISIDDALSLRYTPEVFPELVARHYVSIKGTAFWRDYFIMRTFDRSGYIKGKG